MPRKQKIYHFIYKTTCLVTNKFYIGMHSTNNLEDGYLGSGKRLWYSINKYGKDHHKIEILEFFDIRENLKQKEIQLVNEDLLKDPMCMNLHLGGEGGFTNEEHRKKCTLSGIKSQWNDLEFRKKHMKRFYENVLNKSKKLSRKGENNGFKGKKHTEESKIQIGKTNSEKQKGFNNSQYGTCWITNEKENKKIHKKDIIPQGWKLGRKIKTT